AAAAIRDKRLRQMQRRADPVEVLRHHKMTPVAGIPSQRHQMGWTNALDERIYGINVHELKRVPGHVPGACLRRILEIRRVDLELPGIHCGDCSPAYEAAPAGHENSIQGSLVQIR